MRRLCFMRARVVACLVLAGLGRRMRNHPMFARHGSEQSNSPSVHEQRREHILLQKLQEFGEHTSARIAEDATTRIGKMASVMSPAAMQMPQPVLDAQRNLHFFVRATFLFVSYKTFETGTNLVAAIRGDSREAVEEAWAKQHDWGGRQLYRMACDLRGFHLKGAQWLSARPDICPPEWVAHLSQLQDKCPPLSRKEVEAVIHSELGSSISEIFCEWDEDPIGSASIAQVHRAVLRQPTRRKRWWRRQRLKAVAVKVQRPGAKHKMLRDLDNLRLFFRVPVVRASLAWEPEIIFDQVEAETKNEFDFIGEAAVMDKAAAVLRRPPGWTPLRRWVRRATLYQPPIAIPTSVPGLVSRQLLVMDLLPGIPLSGLFRDTQERNSAIDEPDLPTARPSRQRHDMAYAASPGDIEPQPVQSPPPQQRFNPLQRALAARMLKVLGEAYGRILFEDGLGGVHADPHPGNILLKLGHHPRIALVDWGQVKCFNLSMRLRLAQMVEVLCAAGDDAGRASSDEVVAAFRMIGVCWNSSRPLPEQRAAVGAVATEWFDTTPMPLPFSNDPSSPDYPALALGELTAFPTELLYFFRATQLLRAMSDALGIRYSLVKHWRPHARRLLRHHGHDPDAWTYSVNGYCIGPEPPKLKRKHRHLQI
mmetsp:Transcript_155002/g.281933  ORF Transcript_155002/g.281933 Transcript_155002/m.281933 type:complete len:649 (-) Transcript_155002:323-2269(-)